MGIMDIETQIKTYFATNSDVTEGGEQLPDTTKGNTVRPLIDGRSYFGAIRSLLSGLGTGPNKSSQFFYMTGWWLHLTNGPGRVTTQGRVTAQDRNGGSTTKKGYIDSSSTTKKQVTTKQGDTYPRFLLMDDKQGPYPLMSQLLAEKAEAGVDVRVMGWVNPEILSDSVSNQAGGYWNVNVGTLMSIDELRELTIGYHQPLARNACALTVGHTLGAIHLKMVVAHDGTKPWGFIGGIDFVPSRIAGNDHLGTENWHDMAVSVNGPAVQTFYNLFRNLWNEQISRGVEEFNIGGKVIKSVAPGTSPIPVRSLPSTGNGKHAVEVAITLPQYHIHALPTRPPLSFAPNGVFSVKVAWRKAISNAKTYIYMEDQSFWSQEIMDFIRERIKNNDNLKVILLSGAPDPADPPSNGALAEAINNHLLAGLSASQLDRIGFFLRNSIIVHSKVTIIDDHWLFVGSSNCMRRSLYTDGEMSIGILDENDVLARETRVKLWGEHYDIRSAPARISLNDISRALTIWKPSWGSPPLALPTNRITAVTLPLPPPNLPFDPGIYHIQDADSRMGF